MAALHYAAVHALTAFYPPDVLDRWAPPVNPDRALELYRVGAAAGDLQLVAEKDDRIVGFVIASIEAGELHACYIAPSAGGQGIGRRLVSAVESAARDHGQHLDVRSSVNAEPFYTALGFVRTGAGHSRFDDGTQMPVIFMRKILG